MKKWATNRGSHYPPIGIFFDIGLTIRALMKIGLNLIAAYCPNTPVNHESFATAVSVIRGKMQLTLRGLERNGFVRPTDVQEIAAADNGHSFRLMHADGTWHVFSSFFGGNVGAFVKIPGPNHEHWRWADIVAPLRSNRWFLETGSVLRPMNRHVEWRDSRVVIPSIEFQRTVSSIKIEAFGRKAMSD